MGGAIPDRWENYKPVGKKIEGTRFIAFKVPLREHVAKNLDKCNRLDGRILLKKIPNLGLIIDLTNTYRYYDPVVFESEGIKYKKIMIPGHETPRMDLANTFIRTCKEFMKNNKDNDKLIGVHCTHGVNRTGYLICNYMISQMNVEPKEAVARFAKARGHKIERENYLEALRDLTKTNTRNWRDRDVEVDDWRQKANQSKSYHRDLDYGPQRSNKRYRERHQVFKRSSPKHSQYSHQSGRNDGSSYRRRRSDRIVEEDQLSISNPTTHQSPHLRSDYYNARAMDKRQRYIYVRKTHDS